jgi:hypothetical protein
VRRHHPDESAAKYFGGLGGIISNMAPINEVNLASLCLP